MLNIIIKFLFLYLVLLSNVYANQDFDVWLKKFQTSAIESGISKKVVNEIMSNAKFLPKVIEYDRYQPEFYEDTFTYIKKRSSYRKIKIGVKLYNKERITIEKIEKEFQVEKELLLALIGIETNFGKYLGKMDIVSSLATLSFDKRRSDFFTKELLDENILFANRNRSINSDQTMHAFRMTSTEGFSERVLAEHSRFV